MHTLYCLLLPCIFDKALIFGEVKIMDSLHVVVTASAVACDFFHQMTNTEYVQFIKFPLYCLFNYAGQAKKIWSSTL